MKRNRHFDQRGGCPRLECGPSRGVARAAYELFDAEIIGIRNGYGGLIEGEYQEMSKKAVLRYSLTLGSNHSGHQPAAVPQYAGD